MTNTNYTYLQLENHLNTRCLNVTKISIEQLNSWIVENSKSLFAYERTWIRQLISFVDVKEPVIDTIAFLRFMKEQRKQSNNRQAMFYFKCFNSMGCSYRGLLTKYFYISVRRQQKKNSSEKDAHYLRTSLSLGSLCVF